MTQPLDRRSQPPTMQVETLPTNREAVERACELMNSPSFFNPFISDDEGVIWNGVELRAECRRRLALRKSGKSKIATCPQCGLQADVFSRMVGASWNTTVNINSAEMVGRCKRVDELKQQYRCPEMQMAIDVARNEIQNMTDALFRVFEIELEPTGELIGRRALSSPFKSKPDAQREAQRLAERFEHHRGYDSENDFWWGRDPAPSRVYRYVVEPV